ncbi:hypothetical protein [Pseudoalteromonas phenolica]|uniref:hypothetical protein n=1 Tax=Pseudoalteromonas phenolica TaxID=161398 RepID=UPI00384AC82B
MQNFRHSAIALALAITLTGCGGSSNSENLTEQQKIEKKASDTVQNPADKTFAELESAASGLASSRYKGENNKANLSPDLVKKTFSYLFSDSAYALLNLDFPNLDEHVKDDGKVEGTASCYRSGSVTYSGLIKETNGAVSAKFDKCINAYGETIQGAVTLKTINADESKEEIGVFFDAYESKSDDKYLKMTGSLLINEAYSAVDQGVKIAISQNILLEDKNGNQVASNFKIEEFESHSSKDYYKLNGSIKFSDVGIVAVNTVDLQGYAPNFSEGEMIFTGLNSSSTIAFNGSQSAYYVDTDLDGSNDKGTYISHIYDFMASSSSDLTLVDIDSMSLPPRVGRPYFSGYNEVDTTTPVTVESGYYYDTDTPEEELAVSFVWYLNDEIIAGQSTNTLPSGIAVFGDKLEVAMQVSDSANTVIGEKATIELVDAPSYVEVSDLPSEISSGQTISFKAQIIDPDNKSEIKAGTLLSGPQGATIDEDGQITWVAPSEMLFSSQQYFFSFDNSSADKQSSSDLSVTVNSAKPLPIARSGIEVAKRPKNILLADFDGDQKNEILTTDNAYRVTLLKDNGSVTEQKWLYPYSLPTEGKIVQVFAENADSDPEKEIYVLTKKGVSIIDDLNSSARKLLSFENEADSAAIADINNDGVLEIAVLHQKSSSYYDNKTLKVYSLDALGTLLFETDVGEAYSVLFANVDEDSNIELVVNNGLVYDAATWQNQWLSANQFGSHLLAAGDINGDGIDEIVGVYNDLVVYSAQTKSQLAAVEAYDVCSLTVGNLDSVGQNEIILGDCQWGNINAYTYGTDNQLSKLWTADMVDHGSSSLVVGDSDNDGKPEMLWGTGITSSGADMLISADITAEGVVVRNDNIAPQLDYFAPAGWAKGDNNSEQAVFFVPKTQSGYEGGRVLSMSKYGAYTLSKVISSNWNSDRSAVTADFNNDGLDELLLPNTELYDTGLGVMELSSNTITYQLTIDQNSQLSKVLAEDVNGDKVKDALYSASDNIKMVDVYNQSLLASYSATSYINDFSVHYDDSLSMLVSTDKLSLLRLEGSAFSENAVLNKACKQVAYFNFDTDAELEVACISKVDGYYSSDEKSELFVYEVKDGAFEQVHHKLLDANVVSFAISPQTSTEQTLIFVTQKGDSYWTEDIYSTVVFADSKGNKIFSSPNLPGSTMKDGIRVRLDDNGKLNMLLATSSAMYQFH